MSPQRRVQAGLATARSALLALRNSRGCWDGELSSSALSTATAVCALALAEPEERALVSRGLEWLRRNVNADGGWGDTVRSQSNISTTTLCWAAFGLAGVSQDQTIVHHAEAWIARQAGSVTPDILSRAIIERYGNDRTFSVPILTTCALSGRFGSSAQAWKRVLPLPFELAACPPEWFAALRLPVVSYALPALIALGIARHRHRPSKNPLARLLRCVTESRTMQVLAKIQPASGGFLEATPLTSFVAMSLAASGYRKHPVTRNCVRFLRRSVRADGSWPIDTNLATWVTTMAVNALATNQQAPIGKEEAAPIREWLLVQQYRARHPYTNAAPGGWAWTDLPGGVPDADDTSGALLALRQLGALDDSTREAGNLGVQWLMGLQNRDGGVPTFCRGWGKLPFDRSSQDITAHAVRAWAAWLPDLPATAQPKVRAAISRAISFLVRSQQQSGHLAGAWNPLWFGNEHNPDEVNWTYGTSRVLLALAEAEADYAIQPQLEAAARWLVKTQLFDGSWGGGHPASKPSVEETALAVESLAAFIAAGHHRSLVDAAREAVLKGSEWLLNRIEDGSWTEPAPIGFYFAKLWYYERLYPITMTVAALEQAARCFGTQ